MKSFRIYHLLAALAVAAAYLTAEEFGLVHAWLGYAVASLVAIGLLFGLARRAGFSFARLIPRTHRGVHAAVGNGLTLVLLCTIAGVAGTGIAMDRGGTLAGQSIRAHDEHDGRESSQHEDDEIGLGLITAAHAEEAEHEGGDGEHEGPLGEIHEILGNALLPLAAAHVLYLLLFRFDQARFMVFAPRRRA